MRSRSFKILFSFCILFGSSFFLMKTHYLITDGFRVEKVITHHPFSSSWEVNAPFPEEIVNQPFRYLGKGRQSYVFVNPDHSYVIKFARYKKYQTPIWTKLFSLFHIREKRVETFLKEQEERHTRAMESYKIAYEELKDATGVLYLHLNKTEHLKRDLIVLDRMGMRYRVPLDNVIFLIQKYVTPLDEEMKNCQKCQKIGQVEKEIIAFLEGAKQRADKGILNRDFANSLRNSGWEDGRVLEVDVGSFYKADPIADLSSEEEVDRYYEHIYQFAKKHMPDQIPFIDEQREKIRNRR